MTCAVYCRLSREDEGRGAAESESIQNQKALLIAYAEKQGWEICRIYSDEDYSGADRARPAFNELLRDAQAGKFQVVLCKNQSRFTRDMELVEKYLHGLFPLWGVRFVAVVDNADTAARGNKKARQINGLVNEWYLEDLSENIRAVLDQKRRDGQYIGSFPLYGYQKDPADRHHLIPDPTAAAIVREIFSHCLSGMGKQRIADLLNSRGVPNPTAYKRQAGLAYQNGADSGSGRWNRTTVGRILHNEVYCGTLVQGVKRKPSYKSDRCSAVPKEEWVRVPGTHEPLIAPETFAAVQRLLCARTRSDGSGSVHLLAGRVFCADCGAPMIKVSHVYKGQKHSYLQCSAYAANRAIPHCTRHSIRLDRLEDAVAARIRGYAHSLCRMPDGRRLSHVRDGEALILERNAKSLRGQIARRDAAVRSLYLDHAQGLVPPETFRELLGQFCAERETLQARLTALESQRREQQNAPGIAGRIEKLWGFDPIPRAVIGLVVGRIEIGERQTDASQEIRIQWNF
ncbi:recombinase family protein [Anaerotruncus rubiinfantis]|uniref:recombinase family protein n=1 Tax=Anaerotruncus rubiinfantis TaxID=1720200 RepID=UPI0009AC77BB|nr:recombinase family protein [Anaerotruncus rubiinfantis]